MKPNKSLTIILITLMFFGCHPTQLPGLKQIAERHTEKETLRAKEAISNSPVLQNLNEFCTDPELLSEFNLRSINLSNKSIFLSYHYYSPLDIDAVRDRFVKILSKKEWRVISKKTNWDKLATFEKGKYWIILSYFDSTSGDEENYAVEC